ncbi:MAG: extracellular solute-binding protein [Chloroflexi bacterium]|nr:extracellular solute-binding protein [Chloroflexota bacterium]
MKRAYVWVVISLLAALVSACAPGAPAPPPSPEVKAPSPGVGVKPAWQEKWETTVAAAKKEGKVTLYSVWGAEVTNPLRQAFLDRFGIELEFGSVGRGPALLPRVQTENRAGLFIADAFGSGASTLVTSLKPAGILGPVEPLLILPEVTDAGAWSGGFPFVDRDRYVVGYSAGIDRALLYNTTLIKEGEITSFKDLLKPQYKGKIAMGDPTISGSANSVLSHLAYNAWTPEEAGRWLRQILKQQEAVISRDDRLVTEWVARGKYAIAIGPRNPAVVELTRAGAPIKLAEQTEGHRVTASGGCIAAPARSSHPNAQAVFVNWLLSKEGQTVFAKGYGYPSRRLDVPAEGIVDPTLIIKPGDKLFYDTEERIIQTSQLQELAKKIMQEEGIQY